MENTLLQANATLPQYDRDSLKARIVHLGFGAFHRAHQAVYADILAAEFPGAVRAPDFTNPSEAKSYISSLDFLVAGRMHACIAAVSAGVPVVPVAYSRKFSGLFGQLDYSWIVPVKGMATDDALAFLNDCLAQRDQLAKDAAAGMTKVDRMLDVYRGELRRFFATAAGR